MQFSPSDQLAALADTIAAHERQLKAISGTVAALATELNRTLDALAWDRARLQGWLILASQPQPVVASEDGIAVDDGSEVKLVIAGPTEPTDEMAAQPAVAPEDPATIKSGDADAAVGLAETGVTDLVEVASHPAQDAHAIGVLVGERCEIGSESGIDEGAVPAGGASMGDAACPPSADAHARGETTPAETEVVVSSLTDATSNGIPTGAAAPGAAISQVAISEAEATDVAAAAPAAPTAETPVPEMKIEAAAMEAQPVEAVGKPIEESTATAGNVIDLAVRRRQRSRGQVRIAAAAIAASLVAVVTAAGFYTGALNSELGAHLSRLGVCGAEALVTDRGCAVLAWLSL